MKKIHQFEKIPDSVDINQLMEIKGGKTPSDDIHIECKGGNSGVHCIPAKAV